MQVDWAVLCRLSVIDQETNNISLISLLEQVTFPQPDFGNSSEASGNHDKPNVRVELDFEHVSNWSRWTEEAGVWRGRLEVVDPRGKQLGSQDFDVDLTAFARSRMRSRFNWLPFTEFGTYLFNTYLVAPEPVLLRTTRLDVRELEDDA